MPDAMRGPASRAAIWLSMLAISPAICRAGPLRPENSVLRSSSNVRKLVTLRGELSLERCADDASPRIDCLLGDNRVVGRRKTFDEVENLL